MKKTPDRPPIPASSFRVVYIIALIYLVFWIFLTLISVDDMNEAKLTYDDCQYGEYTYLSFTMEPTDQYPYYLIYVKELADPLRIDSLFYSEKMTYNLNYLTKGELLCCYVDDDQNVVEMTWQGFVHHEILTLDEYTEKTYLNRLAIVIFYAVISGMIFLTATVTALLCLKAKRHEKKIRQLYRIHTVRTAGRHRGQKYAVMSRAAFFLTVGYLVLQPFLFFILLAVSILAEVLGGDGSIYATVAGASLFLGGVLLAVQYHSLNRYGNHAFIRKLYATDITCANLPLDQDSLTKILIQQDYNHCGNSIFYKTKEIRHKRKTKPHTFTVSLVTEEGLAKRARELEVPFPIEKKGAFSHEILFVTVESSLSEAIGTACRFIEYTAFYRERSSVPILLHEGNCYYFKIGSANRPYRIALNEMLLMLGLL